MQEQLAALLLNMTRCWFGGFGVERMERCFIIETQSGASSKHRVTLNQAEARKLRDVLNVWLPADEKKEKANGQ